MKKAIGIYRFTNIKNGDCYIGSSVNVYRRKSQHLRDLKNNSHDNSHFQNSYNKHGLEKFFWEVLEVVDNITLLESREQHFVDKHQPNLNKRKVVGSNIGLESKLKGIPRSNEVREKIRKTNTGKKRTSVEYLKKMSLRRIGCFLKLKKSKKVVQLSLKGEFIKEWDYIADICRSHSNFRATNLSAVCRGKLKSYKGSIWLYSENYSSDFCIETYLKRKTNKNKNIPNLQLSKSIVKLSLLGDLLQTYPSITQASNECGIHLVNIVSFLKQNRKRNHAGGFIWMYESHYLQNVIN